MASGVLSEKQREELLKAFEARFEKNMNRHKGLAWADVQAKLDARADKLWSLNEMERTGGVQIDDLIEELERRLDGRA